ncbi:YbaK/EbsC family protein [Glutamicibacter sp. MNS18]|uniref:aminoacyl-tRNA deacylase n=1 Tax=Glutamicibacter sp. MNS18 TaxID=2989817 RepID=UPI0022361113|nr:YbaK/EbsC family protein [Glutamicibacter sp. MNS18]MCW4464145.1 YbaK/EbsC family protein [Glutamicibacter sp. MNS18]
MDPANEQNDALSRVTLDAARRNIPLEIVPRAAAASLREAADLLGIEPERLVKTLVLKRSDGSFLFVLVPGGRAMSWPKLRALLSVNKLSLPNEQAAFEVTGYRRGTITPFGSRTSLPVVVDQSVFQDLPSPTIALGSGDPRHALFVDPQALVNGFGATVADISSPE